MTNVAFSSAITNWVTVIRLPFTSVAVMPFAAGVFIGYRSSDSISWTASILGLVAVFFICITCYLIGEIYDREEDLLTLKYMRTRFSGGTLAVADGPISPRAAGIVATVLLCMAAVCGFYICHIHSSRILLGLGIFGALAAVVYSLPPVRLVKHGLGELFIGVCYGWLTLFTGFATATGKFPSYSYLFALPQALSIFNVILFNEFPDYDPDRTVGKKNLVVHMGRDAASKVYGTSAFLVAVTTLLIWRFFHPGNFLYLLVTLPVVFLSLFLAVKVGLLDKWKQEKNVEPLCGQGILLNLLVAATLAFLVVF
ncbi:MAG: prenyltransferase [Deltaproteobacteria bacterium]|nr:prenyltransferase [Deltaproteobacteria bacterium]